jgi:hypothetical protein
MTLILVSDSFRISRNLGSWSLSAGWLGNWSSVLSSNQGPPTRLDVTVRTHDARRLAGFVTLSVLLAGCTNEIAGAPIGTGQIVDSNPTVTGSAPPSSSGSAPTPTIPDLPAAADGSDITACYDGTCEVELRAPVTIPIDPATGITTLTLERVDDVDGAYLTGSTTGGGTLEATLYAGLNGSATAQFNGFTIEALATVNGIAVLRLSPPR